MAQVMTALSTAGSSGGATRHVAAREADDSQTPPGWQSAGGTTDDPLKLNPGACGCGVPDTDHDGDGIFDCNDQCPDDPTKAVPGTCGCGVPDGDIDADGVLDCLDNCPNTKNADQLDCDGDGVGVACSADPSECCGDGKKNVLETDVDCGGTACDPCAYAEDCAVGTDCASGVCVAQSGGASCGCAGPGTCPDGVCDGETSLCVECLVTADCPGAGEQCQPETCDASSDQCVASPLDCGESVFYGVVEGPGGVLKSIRCTVAAGGQPSCDMEGGVLKLYPPLCGP